MKLVRWMLLGPAVVAIGCSEDPRYLQPGIALEVNGPEAMVDTAFAQVELPIRLERAEELEDRVALADELGIDVSQIPFVPRDDLKLSIEWLVRNLSEEDGIARIQVNGANEYFAYFPGAFVVDPEEEEEPPPLMGNVPLEVPAGATITGVFREDQLDEASLDLELITRGGISPFAALLARHNHLTEFIDAGSGAVMPAEVFASLIRFDITFLADRHMVLEVAVRVRDRRRPALTHAECLDFTVMPMPDACSNELTGFAPSDYAPPPMME